MSTRPALQFSIPATGSFSDFRHIKDSRWPIDKVWPDVAFPWTFNFTIVNGWRGGEGDWETSIYVITYTGKEVLMDVTEHHFPPPEGVELVVQPIELVLVQPGTLHIEVRLEDEPLLRYPIDVLPPRQPTQPQGASS